MPHSPVSHSVPTVVVTGANGLVGAAVCGALAERGAHVRAIVRRAGSAPAQPTLEEIVGDFSDAGVAGRALDGAAAVISTVYPMGADDRATRQRISVDGTARLATLAAAAGVARHVHISTAAVYDRSPEVGDIDESGRLVSDDANDYAVTKRDTDLAIATIGGITRVLLRPPALLGPGPSSVWNTVRPQMVVDDPAARAAIPEQTWPWVHVRDLAALAADLATGAIRDADDVKSGPVPGGCVPVNVAAAPATQRDYVGTVSAALGLEPEWRSGPAWTGALIATRARGWGWNPQVGLEEALAELTAGLRPAA